MSLPPTPLGAVPAPQAVPMRAVPAIALPPAPPPPLSATKRQGEVLLTKATPAKARMMPAVQPLLTAAP
eukprot:11450313-Heterocapsa_arctica.AAC.1